MTQSTCQQCGFCYSRAMSPGGMCPRCLLFGGVKNAPLSPEAPSVEDLRDAVPGYTVEAVLGRGGMGAVYRARQLDLDRDVAIKFVATERLDPTFGDRFEREAKVLAKLNHPNIVSIHRFGRTADDLAYIVMEYVEGTDLARLIEAGRIPEATALPIVEQVCSALSYAHEAGCVHRDIKPANILLDRAGRVKVADFGLAKILADTPVPGAPAASALTLSFVGVGTAHYAAPEQTKPGAIVDHRADIYALGVLLYEMLTGEVPRGVFKRPSEKSGTRKSWDSLILRAMSEQPEERFPKTADITCELVNIRRQLEPRSRWKIAAMAAAACVLVGGSIYAFTRPKPDNINPAGPVAPAPTASGAFQNGSFDDIHNGNATGWIMTGPVHPHRREIGEPTVACFGAGEHPPTGVLSQTFTTVAGKLYTVSFEWGAWGHPPWRNDMRFRVSVHDGREITGPDIMTPGSAAMDGVSDPRIIENDATAVFADQASSDIKRPYTGSTVTFTARSGVTTLVFADNSVQSDNADLYVDDVKVTPAP